MKQTASAVRTAVLARIGEATNRTLVLPLLIFYPTSRCNSRCVSCDWWQHSGADDLTLDEIRGVARALSRLGTRVVAFSGGEPLLRGDVFDVADVFRSRGMSLQLLTSGVLLDRLAGQVAERFSRVYVSLDAASAALYAEIRGIDALDVVNRGIARLRRLSPRVPVVLRATIHRHNYREIPRLIEHAHLLGAAGISFLPADVSSDAFGRRGHDRAPAASLALDRDEIVEFRALVERTIALYVDDFESGFVAESPDKLRRLPQYYAALAGDGPFPPVRCNAPWVSVVLEASGAVRPCFFHAPVGNIRSEPFERILNDALPSFRRTLDVRTSDVCARCVCSLHARAFRHLVS